MMNFREFLKKFGEENKNDEKLKGQGAMLREASKAWKEYKAQNNV